jgi:structural maintenance of chromosome 4
VEDASISPSFYLALRDTLVVSDLDTAVRIAYVGDRCMWRVVTQDGNLIDTTGTMSGGGKVVKTGSMRLSSAGGKAKPTAFSVAGEGEEEVTAAVVAHMDLQVSELQTRLSECRATKLSSESELKCLRKQLKDVSTEVEKGRLLINRLNEQEGELVNRMRDLAAQAELTPQEAEEVDRQHARLVELERDMLDISPFQKEVASLQRQIRSVGGPQLVAAQQRVDSMATQLEKVSSQLSTKQVDETGARKQAEKSAAARITAEAELRKTEQRLQALVLEQQEMEADAGVVVAALEESRERLAAMEEGLKSISAEYSALKALVAKVRAVEVDLEVEVERIAVEIKESSDVAKKYHKDSAAVRKQHLEEQVEFNAVIRSVAMPPRPSCIVEISLGQSFSHFSVLFSSIE